MYEKLCNIDKIFMKWVHKDKLLNGTHCREASEKFQENVLAALIFPKKSV